MFYALTGLLNAVSSSILGIFVYLKNPKQSKNKTFTLFCVFIAFWSYCYFFWLTSTTEEVALLWCRLLMAGAIFIPAGYLHFVFAFTQETKKSTAKIILFFGYLISLFFLFSDFTPWFVADVRPRLGFRFWPSAGPLYAPFLLVWFSYAIASVVLLYKAYRNSIGAKRSQLGYILLGTAVGYLGGATNYFLWYDIPIPPFGNLAISLYVFLIAYSILKHHLFNIRAITAELLTFAIWFFLLVRTLLSQTLWEFTGNIILFVVVLAIGILLIRSIWKEVEQREKLEILTKQLQRLGEIKTQFVIATQHHIRGPLATMKGYLDLIFEKTYGEVPEKIKDILLKFQISTYRLIKVVDELLDISQFQLGKEAVKLQPDIQIGSILKEIADELQFEAKVKGLYLQFKEPAKAYTIKADPDKLKVALTNLVDNAIKYTRRGGVTIKVMTKDTKVLIAIRDTGIGIPKEEQGRLFSHVFERGKEGTKIHRKGKGIGLYITNQIIKAHKGKIWAESEGKGKGSIFYVELPI